MSINKSNSNSTPEKPFNVIISCSLSKDAIIYSNDYNSNEDCKELNNPFNAYTKHNYTILKLLDILSNIAKEELNGNKKHLYKWKQILEDCKGWSVDEEIVEQQ